MAQSFEDRSGFIWFDGKLVKWSDAKIHVLSHAMHYASSVLEGERAYNGKIFLSTEHSQRLLKSCEYMGMESPYTLEEIEKAKQDVLEANNLKDAYIRVVIWRGSGPDMGLSAKRNKIHMSIIGWHWPSYYNAETGANLILSEWRRPSPDTIPSFAKAAGLYMICTISKHTAETAGYNDALMLDYRGYIAEATGANIFFVKDNEVHTPLPDCCLNGLTRQTIIKILKEKNITIHERHIELGELNGFSECWLTGTAAEITPVTKIAEHDYKIGTLTKLAVESYAKFVRS